MSDDWLTPDDRREVRRGAWYALRWYIAVVVFILVASGIGMVIRYYTADVRGKVAANEKIKADPNFRIEAYDRFFNQCASVQSIEQTIAATQAELATSKNERRQMQLNTNLTALAAARADAVNQYNADSHKAYTAGQFKSSDLPYELSTTIPEGGTQCSA